MNVRFVIGPTITPVVQNVTKIAAGVHLDFTKRYSRKLAIELRPPQPRARRWRWGSQSRGGGGLRPLRMEPRPFLPMEVPGAKGPSRWRSSGQETRRKG